MIECNHKQLVMYVLAMSIGSLQVGWAILGNTQCALILIAQFGWSESETKTYNSLLGSIGLIGVCIGSLFGGPFITGGRRRGILLFSILETIGVALTLIRTLPTMLIGRFITGWAGGIFQMCNIKAVQETPPAKWVGVYNTAPGAFLAIGVFLVAFIGGVSLPEDEEDYKEDQMWRLSYAFPMVWVVWQLLMILIWWKFEPLDYLIKQGRDEEALKFLPKIYNIPEYAMPDDEEGKLNYYK